MRIVFNDKVDIDVPVAEVEAFISNPYEVAQCVPDASNISCKDGKSFSLDVKVGVAMISGTFRITGRLAEHEGNRFVYEINGAGVGSMVSIKLLMDLEGAEEGKSRIMWNAEAQISGLVSGISESVIKKISEEKIKEIISNAKHKLEGSKKE